MAAPPSFWAFGLSPSFWAFGLFLLIILFSHHVSAGEGYLPGVSPKGYEVGERLELKVNSLTSVKAQMPYSYYYLPVCKPLKIESSVESLGEILMGDTLENSDYKLHMMQDKSCDLLCTMTLTEKDRKTLKQMIDDDYTVNWLVDDLPASVPLAATHDATTGAVTRLYGLGFPVGWRQAPKDDKTPPQYFMHNYVHITIKVKPEGDAHNVTQNVVSQEHDEETLPVVMGGNLRGLQDSRPMRYLVVGFEVVPVSFKAFKDQHNTATCTDNSGSTTDVLSRPLTIDDDLREISYLYDVKFELSDIPYANRWDAYLHSYRGGESLITGQDGRLEVHWFAIINSLVVVLVLSAIVATILLRILHRDIAKYNELVLNAEEEAEETGWKLVHGDVFRKPAHSTILAALAGSGVQILGMVTVTLVVSAFSLSSSTGGRSPMGLSRGALLQMALLLWAMMGAPAGYTAARFYKMFQSVNWKMAVGRTATMYPGVVFSVFFLVNVFLWFSGSSGAVPFSAIFTLMLVWFCISIPLVFLGAFFGFRSAAISLPVRVNKIPRQVPVQPRSLHPVLTCLAGGSFPFGAVFTELMFIFSSIWQHRAYYLFGVLLLVLFILILTCVEIAIALVYFQLVCEDYNWWWRSFFVTGSSAFYVFVYALFYFFTRLSLTHVTSIVLYFGYTFIFCYSFFILTGSTGFIATFLFIRKIYGSIKVD